MNDSRKLAVHFLSAMLGNSAVIKRELFRGDDATTRISDVPTLGSCSAVGGEGAPSVGNI